MAALVMIMCGARCADGQRQKTASDDRDPTIRYRQAGEAKMVGSFRGRVSRHRPIEESIVVLNMDDDASAMGYSGHSRAIAVSNVKRIPFVTVDQDCRWNDATSRLAGPKRSICTIDATRLPRKCRRLNETKNKSQNQKMET